jgi:16S rRNA processing protein RimM
MIQLIEENFIPVGTIIKPHGLRGEMIVEVGEGFEDSLSQQECLMVGIEGGLVPYFITDEGVSFRTPTSLSLAFDDIDSSEKVRPLCGCKVYLPKEASCDRDTEDSFDELIGFVVFDKTKGKLGKIIRTDNYSGNIVLTVKHNSREILLPFSEELVYLFSDEQKEIHLDCPEGLIDLYLK